MKGSTGQNRSMKDKSMAAALKAAGATRTITRCPLCHVVIGAGMQALLGHFSGASCRARRPRFGERRAA